MGDWLEYIRGLSFGAPTYLVVLLTLGVGAAIAGLVWISRRSRLMLRPITRILVVVGTGVSLLALGLAYGEVIHTKQEKHLAVALLVDGSASVPDAELERARQWVSQAYAQRGDTWLRTVVFSKDTRLLTAADTAPTIDRPDDSHGTDIAAAVGQAIELFPENHTRRLVLLTDGNQTEGDLVGQAASAAGHGVELHALMLGTRDDRDLFIEAINVPAAARPGELVKVSVVIVSNFETPARLQLSFAGRSIFNETVEVKPGRNVFETETRVRGKQSASFIATVNAEGDMHDDNNKLSASMRVASQPSVALFSGDLDQDLPLVEALDAARITVRPGRQSTLPRSAGALYPFDVVVLSDLDYKAMSDAQQAALMQYARDGGGGVVVLGGDKTGELGKKKTEEPIEKMMPVRFKEKKKTEPNPVTLVLVIDKSASMARERKFAMAVRAANETIDALAERSRVGVVLFDDFPRWAVHMQKVGDAESKQKLQDKLRSFGVDGGTSIYPAIGEAYKKLKDDKAKVKHIILLSDGISLTTFDQWGHLVEWMGGKRITISTVALGKESDQPHLRKIAEVGGGRYYYTEDFTQIPRIFLEETKKISKTGAIEKKIKPELLKKGDMLEGLPLTNIPHLAGYNTSDPKPTSEVFLTAERGEPLLTRWRFGLGRVTVLGTDSGAKWAAGWRKWGQYAPIMAHIVRGTMADLALRNYRIEARSADDFTNVNVDATDQYGNFVNDLKLTLKVSGPDDFEGEVVLSQSRPGGYDGRFQVPQFGTYSLRVVPEGGGLIRSQGVGQVNLTPPPEFVATRPNRALLTRATATGGGKLNPSIEEIFAVPEVEYPHRKPLWNVMLYVALGSLLLTLLIRRGILGG
ncbi:MAG: VWA domain-containing protein [Candidatus Lernaella stagnicola]|nr:VWA domain-containing protein [Candidatus Lernaella stagnicola]